jgi:hypothetical protein
VRGVSPGLLRPRDEEQQEWARALRRLLADAGERVAAAAAWALPLAGCRAAALLPRPLGDVVRLARRPGGEPWLVHAWRGLGSTGAVALPDLVALLGRDEPQLRDGGGAGLLGLAATDALARAHGEPGIGDAARASLRAVAGTRLATLCEGGDAGVRVIAQLAVLAVSRLDGT